MECFFLPKYYQFAESNEQVLQYEAVNLKKLLFGKLFSHISYRKHIHIYIHTEKYVNFFSYFIDISGNVLCLSIIDLEEGNIGPWKVLAGVCSSDHIPGCNQLIEMEIDKTLLSSKFSILFFLQVCIFKVIVH